MVIAYSGGKLTYAGISQGKVKSEANSDGYYFKDKCSGDELVEVGGDVTILRPQTMPSCDHIRSFVEAPTFKIANGPK